MRLCILVALFAGFGLVGLFGCHPGGKDDTSNASPSTEATIKPPVPDDPKSGSPPTIDNTPEPPAGDGAALYGRPEPSLGKSARPPAEITKVDQSVFVLFALEDMSRQFTALSNAETGAVTSPQAKLAWLLAQLRSMEAYQRVVYDTLWQEVQKGKDDEFNKIYRTYDKKLLLIRESFLALEQSMAKYLRGVRDVNARASMTALTAGASYGLRSVAEGDDDDRAIVRAVSGMLSVAASQQGQVNAYLAQFGKDLDTARKAFEEQFENQIDESTNSFTQMIKRSRWRDSEFAFSLKEKKASPIHNPFAIVRQAGIAGWHRETPPEVLVMWAEACKRAADVVPGGNAFDPFRALFLSVGGRLASTVAVRQRGAAGFPESAKEAPVGGQLSRDIFISYLKYETDAKINDDVVRAVLLSHAHAGDRAGAFQALRDHAFTLGKVGKSTAPPIVGVKAAFSANPGFWYDAARVCSITNNPKQAVECLNLAVRNGFRDADMARFNPDLKNVRLDATYGKDFDLALKKIPTAPGGLPGRPPTFGK